MFRRHHAISVQQATQESPTLAHLAALAQESQNRLKALDSLIPAGLRTCIQAGPIDGTSWCLLVSGNAAAAKVRRISEQLAAVKQKAGTEGPLSKDIADLQRKISAFGGGGGFRRGPGGPASGGEASFGQLGGTFMSLMNLLQDADVIPSTQAVAAVDATQASFERSENGWRSILDTDIPALNSKLRAAGLTVIVP